MRIAGKSEKDHLINAQVLKQHVSKQRSCLE